MAVAVMGGIERPTQKPHRPARKERAGIAVGKAAGLWFCRAVPHRRLRAGLAGAANHILVAGQLFGPDWTTGVELVGGDADFRTHAKFTAIGKLG